MVAKNRGGTELGGFNSHVRCCAVHNYEESGCKVHLPNRQRGWVCLSGDKYTECHGYTGKLADLLFAWRISDENHVSCVLELKSGKIRVSQVVDQLQQGALVVDGLLRDMMAVRFLPVLVHGPIPTMTYRKLDKQKVRFRGKAMGIRLLNCGDKVEKLIW